MKNIFILLLFLCSCTSVNSQKILCHPTGPEAECFYAFVGLNEYIDDTSVVVMFNSIEPLHPAFQGITWQYNRYLYLVSINVGVNDPAERLWTIFHEIGHVIDMYEGRLRQFPMMWEDKVIKENLSWNERPWEQSAEEWAYRMWNRFMDIPPPHNPKLNMYKIQQHNCIKH